MTEPLAPGDEQPTMEAPPSGPIGKGSRFAPGTLLAGRYRVIYPLGQGGMGEVYRADDLKLGQPVALKFVRHNLASSAKRRLYGEVRLGRQVSHPNVCRLYDIVEVEGLTFIAMEYVDGEDLASLLARIGHLPPDKALEIARDLCGGLQAAHDRGVLHRDLKPANVMIDGRGHARLTDFGLAVEKEGGTRDTAGTALYMSPEQLVGGEVTARSDVYALGLILYEMIVGRRFFTARTLDELRNEHRTERLSRLGVLSGQIDSAFQRAIAQCLEEDPQARPASARAVVTLLPGGDRLEAAIAAGETPSPEAVAAAGTVGDLKPAVAWTGLAAALGGLALFIPISDQLTLLPRTPPPKTHEVLLERARTVASVMAATAAPEDSVGHFDWDWQRFEYVTRNDRSPNRFDRLRDSPLSPLLFLYRQSPQALVAKSPGGVVRWNDPPLDVPGMVGVSLDPQGRLRGYVAVPPQVEAGGPWPDPDWSPLFREAQLDPAAFRSVPSEWSAPVDSDRKAAWEGDHPGIPDAKLRVEAAAYHGRVVWFSILPPWAAPAPAAGDSGGDTALVDVISSAMWRFLSLALPLGGLLLARRNVRLRRVDWRGSLRLALFVFISFSLARLFRTDHISANLFRVIEVLAHPMVFAALVWVGYLALEPYARRQWPRVLISWGRLLAGRWRDPLVGRDVLLGAVAGVFMSVLFLLTAKGVAAMGQAQVLWGIDVGPLDSWRFIAHRVFVNLHGATLHSIFRLFLLVVLVVFLRRRKVALGVWSVLVVVMTVSYDLTDYGLMSVLLDLTFTVIYAFLHILVLTRLGLLGYAAMLFFVFLVREVPITFDGSLWWAPRSWAALAVLVALCVWAFQTSLGGKPALGDWLET